MNEEMFRALRSDIRAGLDVTSVIGNDELAAYIERIILEREQLRLLTAQEKHELVKKLFDSFRGWIFSSRWWIIRRSPRL